MLQVVMNYHYGKGKYNFSNLPEAERYDASFDAWMEIRDSIEELLNRDKKPKRSVARNDK